MESKHFALQSRPKDKVTDYFKLVPYQDNRYELATDHQSIGVFGQMREDLTKAGAVAYSIAEKTFSPIAATGQAISEFVQNNEGLLPTHPQTVDNRLSIKLFRAQLQLGAGLGAAGMTALFAKSEIYNRIMQQPNNYPELINQVGVLAAMTGIFWGADQLTSYAQAPRWARSSLRRRHDFDN